MQTKNQYKFGIIQFSIALFLSILIFSCSKTGQLDQGIKPIEELATTSNDNAARTYQSQQTWLYDDIVWIPCANDGAGEYVKLDGYVHFTYIMSINNNRFTLITQTNPNEVLGTGLTTGIHYVGTGGGEEPYLGSMTDGQWSSGGTTKFLFVGAGPGNDLSVTFKAHVVVNANGEISSELQDAKYSCD